MRLCKMFYNQIFSLNSFFLSYFIPFIVAGIISCAVTPLVIKFTKRLGIMDVPKDERRMHNHPIPRLGGIAIFIGFLCSFLLFGNLDYQSKTILIGAIIIVVLGIFDDIFVLGAKLKLIIQIIAATIPVLGGTVIRTLTNPNFFSEQMYIDLGFWSIPITILWIVGLTNAVNLIDGLDGLAVGVSSIAAVSVFSIAVLQFSPQTALIMAILAGACFGFLPFNINPAKIFMGDTGATFLGYILAVISVQGLFKFYTVISFAVPFIVLGLPIFDTSFAILRRISHGQSPMAADRGHIHHRLIDMGFSQKQSVAILYSLSALLGLFAVMLTISGRTKFIFIIFLMILVIVFLIGVRIMSRHITLSTPRKHNEGALENINKDSNEATLSPENNRNENLKDE